MTTTAHYAGAPMWHVAAARHALPAARFPSVDAMGPDRLAHGVQILHGPDLLVEDRITVAVYVGHHLGRPRPGAARTRWEEVREEAVTTLQQHGWSDMRLTLGGADLTAPTTAFRPCAVTITPAPELGAVGEYTVTVDGHPTLVAELNAHYHHGVNSGSGGFAMYNAGRLVDQGWRRIHDAAEAWAQHCGFGPRHVITVTELRRGGRWI